MLASRPEPVPVPGNKPVDPAYRPLPQSMGDLGVPEIFLANLTLKHCFYLDTFYL
jgi:hypothetical protein